MGVLMSGRAVEIRPKPQPNPHHTAILAVHKEVRQILGQWTLMKLESVGVDPNGKTVGYFVSHLMHPFDFKTYRVCMRFGIETTSYGESVVFEHEFPLRVES
jgi:hypothetical protein